MVKLVVNLLIAAWLFASAYLLPHSTATAWNSMLVAVAIVGLAFIALAAVGQPGARYSLSVVAIWLFASTMFMPHVSLGTVLHDAFVATVLALVSLLPPKKWGETVGADEPRLA